MKLINWLAAAMLALGAAPAAAAGPGDFGVSDIRAGLYVDSIELLMPFVPDPQTISVGNLRTLDFEVLFRSPDVAVFHWLGSPKIHVGADISLAGRESMAHAGLTWQWRFGDSPFFTELAVGGAIHNGALSGALPPARNLGCPALFYGSMGLGIQLSDQTDLLLTGWHASQIGFCGHGNNQGLNGIGAKWGYRF